MRSLLPKRSAGQIRLLWPLLLTLAGLACDATRWRTIASPADQTCSPASQISSQDPTWQASFGNAQHNGAWGCLRRLASEGIPANLSPVFLRKDGKVLAWDPNTQRFAASPSFPSSSQAGDGTYRFKLFVLQPGLFSSIPLEGLRHDTLKSVCSATDQDSYDCGGIGQSSVCWFTIEFAIAFSGAGGQLTQCKTIVPGGSKEPSDTEPDAAEPAQERPKETPAESSEPSEPPVDAPPADAPDASEPPTETPADKATEQCEFSIDCPQGSICTIDKVCHVGECDPKGPPTCAEQKVCMAFKCQLLGCAADGDCPDNAYCKDSLCTPKQCGTSTRRCAFGKICVEFICTTRATCQTDRECASGNERCLRFVAEGGKQYCVKKCLTSLDCPRGMECRDTEGQSDKFCFQERTRKLGEQCTPLDQACVNSLLCLRSGDASTTGQCVQTCSEIGTSNGCPADHVCEPAETTGVCLPFGSRKKDQECHGTNSRCEQGLVCVSLQTIGKNLCKTRCQPKVATTTCAMAEKCYSIDTDNRTGACIVPTIRQEGESCAFANQECDTGLACVKLVGQTTSGCWQPCTNNGSCNDPRYPVCGPAQDNKNYCQPPSP